MSGDASGKPRARTLGGVIGEKDEELALFLEMRRREKERGAAAAEQLVVSGNGVERDGLLPIAPLPAAESYKVTGMFRRAPGGADRFLNADGGDKNDYNWLLTPPKTPLFPSLDVELKRSPVSQVGTPKARPTALKSRLVNDPDPDPPSRTNLPLRTTSLNSLNSAVTTRRPSSSGGLTSNGSRPSTPTGHSSLAANSKGSRPSTPTPRATVPAKSGTSAPRSSTPTSRSTLPSARLTTPSTRAAGSASRTSAPSGRASAPASRSSTPTSRSSIPAARSSTPSRPLIPAQSKPVSRASTPTRWLSAPSVQPGNLAAPVRSSSISKAGSKVSKGSSSAKVAAPTPSRGSSPTVKSRPWNPSEMPGFSLDVPPNLRTSLPEILTSATRGRPSSGSLSIESGPAARPRQQSCSPSRGRTLNGSVPSGSSMLAVRRSHHNGGDNVNPVQMGNKMVERVVNMRGLLPTKHDDQRSSLNSLSGKSSSSPDSFGFGRTAARPRRQSCSPSRGRTLNGSVPSGSSILAVRSHHNGDDSVNPVQMGNKMAERVVNMRGLLPTKHDDQRSSLNSLSGKSSTSPDSSGFGRTAARPRRQSCSPSRGRTLNGSVPSGSSMLAVRRSHHDGGDNVNPVEMGNKMVERVVNMRGLHPTKHDDQRSSLNSLPGKSSNSSDSSGFGRTAARPRRQSCSPSRGRTLNGSSVPSGSSMLAVRKLHHNGGDNVGNKMVERVVNMRGLLPTKHDDQRSSLNSLSGKSSNSPDSSGFGRTQSKSLLDMALHMDIRRSIPNNLHPVVTSIPTSSVHSARSGSTWSRSISVSDSPLATSSNASSEPSINNNLMYLDSFDIDDELCSNRAGPYGR